MPKKTPRADKLPDSNVLNVEIVLLNLFAFLVYLITYHTIMNFLLTFHFLIMIIHHIRINCNIFFPKNSKNIHFLQKLISSSSTPPDPAHKLVHFHD